ncbi:MAG: helix-turn-helix domain-containing protein [Oscillospiraceae bacterium]|nr:helix-turn-helix domain-containing protein [Oscillospiraceae bacterium]
MFKHKAKDGTRNLCGKKVMALRMAMVPKVSQRKLAEMVQLYGVDIDKTAVRRIEIGERYVTDIELKILCEIFQVSADFLLDE